MKLLEEEELFEELSGENEEKMDPQTRKEIIQKLHIAMDLGLRNVSDKLKNYLNNDETELFLKCFTQAIEEAIVKAAKLDEDEARRFCGRSKPCVVRKTETMVHDYNSSTQRVESPLTTAQKSILSTARRNNHIMKTSEAREKSSIDDVQKRARHGAEIHASFRALKNEPVDLPEYREAIEHIERHINDLDIKYFTMAKIHERIMKRYETMKTKKIKRDKQRRTTR